MSIIIIILISVLNSNCQYDDQQQNYDDQYQQNPVQDDYTGDESKFLPYYYESPVPDFVQDQDYSQFQMAKSIDDGPQMLYNLPLPRQNTQGGDESCICVPNGMCPTGPVRIGGIATHGVSKEIWCVNSQCKLCFFSHQMFNQLDLKVHLQHKLELHLFLVVKLVLI